jgi:CRISPR system Cascade subunit CasC
MFIELHLIHALPPSNANRDKSGAPKKIQYGGTWRARLSSQAQKRAARQHYGEWMAVDRKALAFRSRRHDVALASRLAFGDDADNLMVARFLLGLFNLKDENLIPAMLEDSSNLLFLSEHELDTIAAIAADHSVLLQDMLERARRYQEALDLKPKKAPTPEKLSARDLQGIRKALGKLGQQPPGSVALFGRMMASLTEASVDGCTQVADAISVNSFGITNVKGMGQVIGELDFFTAEDDIEPLDEESKSGAGHLGELPIISPVYYRYANVNVTELARLIGDPELAQQFAKGFITAFCATSPTGYIRSRAHLTQPDYVQVQVTAAQPYSSVNAFQAPINSCAGDEDFLVQSIPHQAIDALRQYQDRLASMYGEKSLYKAEVTTAPSWDLPLSTASEWEVPKVSLFDQAIDGALAVAMGAGKEVAYA